MKNYMKKVLAGALVLGIAGSVSAATTVYEKNKTGWETAAGIYATEAFEDATLNEGVSVVSDVGYVGGGVWNDRLEPEGDVTTWTFAGGVTSFGGIWDLAGPGRPGTGIVVVVINGVEVEVGEINQNYADEFWGFVSDTPFTSVLLKTEDKEGYLAETYEMDDMVYSNKIYFDVHPAGCPNPINIKSKGLTPMAILGSAGLLVTDIDPDSLSIKVNGSDITPVKYAYEDVAEPYTGAQSEVAVKTECWEYVPLVEGEEYEGDGYEDLTIKFDTQQLVTAGLSKDIQYLEITGEKYDGTEFTAKDVVWVK